MCCELSSQHGGERLLEDAVAARPPPTASRVLVDCAVLIVACLCRIVSSSLLSMSALLGVARSDWNRGLARYESEMLQGSSSGPGKCLNHEEKQRLLLIAASQASWGSATSLLYIFVV